MQHLDTYLFSIKTDPRNDQTISGVVSDFNVWARGLTSVTDVYQYFPKLLSWV